MKVLRLQAANPAPGTEFHADSYPGVGNYLLPNGRVCLVWRAPNYGAQPSPNLTFMVDYPIIEDLRPEAGNVDFHRLLDQLIELKK